MLARPETSGSHGGHQEVVRHCDIASPGDEHVIPVKTSWALLTFERSCGTFHISSDQRPANFLPATAPRQCRGFPAGDGWESGPFWTNLGRFLCVCVSFSPASYEPEEAGEQRKHFQSHSKCVVLNIPTSSKERAASGESLAVMANKSFLCIFRTCAAGRRSDYNDRVALNESDAAAL